MLALIDLPTYIARTTRGLAIALASVCFSSQISVAAILPDCEAIAAKVEAATGISGIGMNCKTLLLPTKTNRSPRSILGRSAVFKFFMCT